MQFCSITRDEHTPMVQPYNRIRTISRGSLGGTPSV
jgi:hypothetical protein